MNKLLIFVLSFTILFSLATSCAEEAPATPESVDKWKLIEQLSDPGDLSGTFQAVSSDKTIEFIDENTVDCKGSLCSMSTEAVGETTATYNAAEKFILVEGCGGSSFKINYEFEDEFLYLRYPCREPCVQKFEKSN